MITKQVFDKVNKNKYKEESKMQEKFKQEAANPNNPKWEEMIKREQPLYKRENEIRTEFERDYTRIIHSNAYKRLKHKTQVFFCPQNDHICTRIEHINYVESISCTMAKYLGLNEELTRAIAVSHDLGHAPFGHKGEKILSQMANQDIQELFWHEKNGVNMVDNIELLEDEQRNKQNLNLTYAVRDGIISHCGEIDENAIKPRKEAIPLEQYTKPNEYAPYTWEGCLVKISDKISYIFRDIEDALRLKIIDEENMKELKDILKLAKGQYINNTRIINGLSNDICQNSSIEQGITLSKENLEMLDLIKKFNYKNIYFNEKLQPSHRYFEIVLQEIYNLLKKAYKQEKTLLELENLRKFYPALIEEFMCYLHDYWDLNKNREKLNNKVIYQVSKSQKDYNRAILDFISGMTDNYAIKKYNEIISF